MLSLRSKLLSLVATPDSMMLTVICVAAVLLAILFYALIFLINDPLVVKKDEKKAPDTRNILIELQHAMLKELKGTARQNSILIELTILFILISIFGIIIGIEGPERILGAANQARSFANSLLFNVCHAPK